MTATSRRGPRAGRCACRLARGADTLEPVALVARAVAPLPEPPPTLITGCWNPEHDEFCLRWCRENLPGPLAEAIARDPRCGAPEIEGTIARRIFEEEGARRERLRKPRRLLRREIDLALQFAEAPGNRISLERLRGLLDEIPARAPEAPMPAVAESRAPSVPAETTRGSDYWARIGEIEKGITAPGRRWRENGLYLFHLYVTLGLFREETKERHARWLRNGDHRSKDLAADREGTIREMEKATDGLLDLLDRRYRRRAGLPARTGTTWIEGPDGVRREFHEALAKTLAETVETHRERWQEHVVGLLTAQDRDRLATFADETLAQDCAPLIGILRWGEARHGASRLMTVSSVALKKIVGARRYRAARKALEALGYLSQVAGPIERVRSAVYRVELPDERAMSRAFGAVGPPPDAARPRAGRTGDPVSQGEEDTTTTSYSPLCGSGAWTPAADELRALVTALGGVRAAARATGVPKSTLSNYRRAMRPIPAEVLARLRAAVPA